jgi:hypothetical protein
VKTTRLMKCLLSGEANNAPLLTDMNAKVTEAYPAGGSCKGSLPLRRLEGFDQIPIVKPTVLLGLQRADSRASDAEYFVGCESGWHFSFKVCSSGVPQRPHRPAQGRYRTPGIGTMERIGRDGQI